MTDITTSVFSENLLHAGDERRDFTNMISWKWLMTFLDSHKKKKHNKSANLTPLFKFILLFL